MRAQAIDDQLKGPRMVRQVEAPGSPLGGMMLPIAALHPQEPKNQKVKLLKLDLTP